MRAIEPCRKFVTLYDEFRTVAGGVCGYSYRQALQHQDYVHLRDGTGYLVVCYTSSDRYVRNEKVVIIKDCNFSELAAKSSSAPDADWREQARSKIFAYLHQRLTDCKNDPDVRIDKIDLANQALEFLSSLPERAQEITAQYCTAWAYFRNHPVAKKSVFGTHKLRDCFLAVDRILTEKFPLVFIREKIPSQVSVELVSMGSGSRSDEPSELCTQSVYRFRRTARTAEEQRAWVAARAEQNSY